MPRFMLMRVDFAAAHSGLVMAHVVIFFLRRLQLMLTMQIILHLKTGHLKVKALQK